MRHIIEVDIQDDLEIENLNHKTSNRLEVMLGETRLLIPERYAKDLVNRLIDALGEKFKQDLQEDLEHELYDEHDWNDNLQSKISELEERIEELEMELDNSNDEEERRSEFYKNCM
jgi:hypothetical protein